MEVVIYRHKSDLQESLDNFLDQYFSSQLKFFASDLLDEGLTPYAISEAIDRAIVAAKTSGLEIRAHFIPLYTQSNGRLVKDCKLSHLGYALVLLNADVQVPIVAKWQVKLLQDFLKY